MSEALKIYSPKIDDDTLLSNGLFAVVGESHQKYVSEFFVLVERKQNKLKSASHQSRFTADLLK